MKNGIKIVLYSLLPLNTRKLGVLRILAQIFGIKGVPMR